MKQLSKERVRRQRERFLFVKALVVKVVASQDPESLQGTARQIQATPGRKDQAKSVSRLKKSMKRLHQQRLSYSTGKKIKNIIPSEKRLGVFKNTSRLQGVVV